MGGHGNMFLKKKQTSNLQNNNNNNDDVYGLFSKRIMNFEELLQEDEFEEPEGLEKGMVTKYIFNKLTRCEMSCSCFIIIGQICASIDYEMSYLSESKTYRNQDVILTLLTLTTAILSVLSFLRYKIKMDLDKERNVLSKRDDGLSASYQSTFLIELLVIIFHPNNLFKGMSFSNSVYYYHNANVEYQVNHIMTFILHFRIIFLFRNLLHYTVYINPRAFRLCKIYGCECGYLFTMKCLIKLRPTITLTVALLTSIIFFASLIRISERPTEYILSQGDHPRIDNNHVGFFENALWVTVVSLLTIGYGDIYIKTTLGRTLVFFLGFWGIFVISLFVVTIRNVLEISNEENRTLNLLLRLNYRDSLKKEAAKVISIFGKFSLNKHKYRGLEKKKSLIDNKEKMSMIKLKRFMNNFSQTQKKLTSTFDAANICEEFTREFEVLWLEYNECKFNQEKIMNKLGIEEKGESIKNEKTQQGGSFRAFEGIGSKETIKSFPSHIQENKEKGKKMSIEKKLIKDIDEYFRLVPDHQK